MGCSNGSTRSGRVSAGYKATASRWLSIDPVRMWRQLTGDCSGTVAPTFGLLAIAMFLVIGATIDLGRWAHARQQTIRSLDAAVLAGGRILQISALNESEAIAAALKFYRENNESRLLLKEDNVSFKTVLQGTAITAEGTATIDTTFLKLAGINELPLLNLSGSDHSRAVLAVGGNAESSVEISMMLDVSGSMDGQKVLDMKNAAKDLVNIVVWDDQSSNYSKVAIVPFSADVRLPADLTPEASGVASPPNKTISGITFRPTPCVVERKGTQKYTDVTPSSGQYVMTKYTTTGRCTIPQTAEIMGLSSSKEALRTKIDGLTVNGGTAGHLGTAWAWYALSPHWKSVFSGASEPASYSELRVLNKNGEPKLRKIAILMTDGEYNTQYDTNGIQTGTWGAGSAVNGPSATQAVELCKGMKAAGITVYTVGFDLGGNATAINTLMQCASDPTKFYQAEDGEQLKQSFRDIALKISSLYLDK